MITTATNRPLNGNTAAVEAILDRIPDSRLMFDLEALFTQDGRRSLSREGERLVRSLYYALLIAGNCREALEEMLVE